MNNEFWFSMILYSFLKEESAEFSITAWDITLLGEKLIQILSF